MFTNSGISPVFRAINYYIYFYIYLHSSVILNYFSFLYKIIAILFGCLK